MTESTCCRCHRAERAPSQSYCRACFRQYKRERRQAKNAAAEPRACVICGTQYRSPYPHTLTCSYACGIERERQKEGWAYRVGEFPPIACAHCGTMFARMHPGDRFCSKACCWQHHGKARYGTDVYRAQQAAKRARRRGAPTINFTAAQLAARLEFWGGRCWMCGDTATALDHVKPLSKGGWHALANIRPACTSCNSKKNAMWFGVHELDRFMKAA